jgi:hypothetical protein
LIYPSLNIYQNKIFPLLNTSDLIKLIKAFQLVKVDFTKFFPRTFCSKNVVSIEDKITIFMFPASANVESILFFKKEYKFSPLDSFVLNENSDYVFSSNQLLNFNLTYPVYTLVENKQKKQRFNMMLATSETHFVLALKKQEQIKIIWCENCTQINLEDSNIILDLEYFEIDLPKDTGLIVKAKKYSKKLAFKILHTYLNLISRYYNFVLPDLKNLQWSMQWCENRYDELLCGAILYTYFLIITFLGYPIVLTLPLFLETSFISLPILWKNPNLIYFTSILPALTASIHATNFNMKEKPLNNQSDFWLFPHLKTLKTWSTMKICTILQIVAFLDLLILFYWFVYIKPFLNYYNPMYYE